MVPPVVSYRNSTSNHNNRAKNIVTKTVVSYRNSTSNHNQNVSLRPIQQLYLIEILHKTKNCIGDDDHRSWLYLIEILHQTTTFLPLRLILFLLYLIEILHQTTTKRVANSLDRGCILSKFYIKPQPPDAGCLRPFCCILSKFYIKPQHSTNNNMNLCVVSYRNSTSNHNQNPLNR